MKGNEIRKKEVQRPDYEGTLGYSEDLHTLF